MGRVVEGELGFCRLFAMWSSVGVLDRKTGTLETEDQMVASESDGRNDTII